MPKYISCHICNWDGRVSNPCTCEERAVNRKRKPPTSEGQSVTAGYMLTGSFTKKQLYVACKDRISNFDTLTYAERQGAEQGAIFWLNAWVKAFSSI